MISNVATKTPKQTARRSSEETREHVLDVARDLFYWEGIHATGIDRVAAKAGVAPTTLYRLFDSKDDLVAAYVEREGRGYRDFLAAASASSVGSPRERILAMFDAFAEQIGPDNCRGCPFLMALAEFPHAESDIHVNAVSTKAWVRDLLRGLTDELAATTPLKDPAALADQLALVVEGIYGSVQALRDGGPARQARAAAESLIEAAGR